MAHIRIFKRNKYGHITMSIIGLNLFGGSEIIRLEAAGYCLSDSAKSCLLSKKADGYDAKHRLVAQRKYKIAFMPGGEIEDLDRTTRNLRKRGMRRYGYGKPLAGSILRIREKVPDEQLEEMDALYIAALHDSIDDFEGYPNVLCVSRSRSGRLVDTDFADLDNLWNEHGLFAFFDATS